MDLTDSPLVVALDVSSFERMCEIVDLVGEVAMFKVGHQLFTAEGPPVVRHLKAAGHRVFLDLKLHEIPNSVGAAVREAGLLGVDMVSVHASGGGRMMSAAVEAAAEFPNLKIVALTVVSGLDDDDLTEIGFAHAAAPLVGRLAALAERSGCHGVIVAPTDVVELRRTLGPEMLIVAPGVRPAGAAGDDQRRVGTPKEAMDAGASLIVIGRQIVDADDPGDAARSIVAELRPPS